MNGELQNIINITGVIVFSIPFLLFGYLFLFHKYPVIYMGKPLRDENGNEIKSKNPEKYVKDNIDKIKMLEKNVLKNYEIKLQNTLPKENKMLDNHLIPLILYIVGSIFLLAGSLLQYLQYINKN